MLGRLQEEELQVLRFRVSPSLLVNEGVTAHCTCTGLPTNATEILPFRMVQKQEAVAQCLAKVNRKHIAEVQEVSQAAGLSIDCDLMSLSYSNVAVYSQDCSEDQAT